MRASERSKGRKVFEYLVDELSTWITEDQLRVSLSPTLLAELEGNYLSTNTKSEVFFKPLQTLVNVDQYPTSQASQSPSSPPNPFALFSSALGRKPEPWKQERKRQHQDTNEEIVERGAQKVDLHVVQVEIPLFL
jgi:hypothetical protein